MNKRNWISAFLAVMMVISMMACIVVPVAAEQDYALTQEEAEALPSVQEAAMDDGIQSYKISSWADMIYFASSDRYNTTDEYKAAHTSTANYTDYCYDAAKKTNSSDQQIYGRDRYVNPAFVDQSRYDRWDVSTYDRIYLTTNLDVKDYSSASGTGLDAFKADFDHFLAPSDVNLGGNATRYQNSCLTVVFDGLGHTIKGYEDDMAFIAGQATGIFRNVVFDEFNVDNSDLGTTYDGVFIKGINDLGVTFDNAHFRNSNFTINAQNGGGFFVGLANNNNRPVFFQNCSMVDCHIVNEHTSGIQYTGLFAGYVNTPSASNDPGATADSLSGAVNCVMYDCTITCSSISSAGLMFGRLSGQTLGSITLDNIAVFNSGFITTADAANSTTAAAVAYLNGCSSTATTNDVGSIYVGKVTEDATALPQVLYDSTEPYSLNDSVKDANYVTDGTITVGMNAKNTNGDINATTAPEGADYAILDAIQDMNASASYADWGFDTTGNIVLLKDGEKAPVAVSFTANSATTTYYTDVNGNLRVTADENGLPVLADAADITALGTSDWKATDGSAVNAGADWTKVVVSVDTAYNKVSLPPYTMTLDKDTYVKGDIVTATVSLVAGSNLQGVEVGFNYDENVLTPVADAEGNYAIAANGWLVTDKAESENMMAVSAVTSENATEAVDVFSVKFKVTQDLASTATELGVTAVLEWAGGLVGDEMTELDLGVYTTVEIAGAAEIKNNELTDYSHITTPASKATRYDKVDSYYIDSVAELIRTNMALKQRDANGSGYDKGPEALNKDDRLTIWNFEETDTVYLTADLDTTDWEVPDDLATYDEATGVYTPKKVGASTTSANFIYVDNDGTYTNGEIVTCADKQELFNVLYNGFAWGWQVWANYCVQRFNFDGLGHSIKNYSDNHPFFFGNYVGTISNLTFENADVEPIAGGFSGGKTHASIITCGTNRLNTNQLQTGTTEGVVMTNVHIKDSILTVPSGWNSAGFFMCESNNLERGLYLNNCSLTGSIMKVESDQSAYAYSRFGFVVGYRDGWMDIKNSIFEDSHIIFDNATEETPNTAAAPSRQTLLIGSWNDQDDDLTYVIDNVAVVNCGLVAANADTSAAAILINTADFGASVKVSNIYASGNTVATSAGAEPVAIPNLVATSTGTAASVLKITASSVLTDAGVTTLFDNKGTKTENANTTLEAGLTAAVTELEKTITEAHWRVNDDGSLYLLGQEVTFQSKGEEDMVRYTDRINEHILYEETETGFVAVDPSLFTKLTNNYWYNAEISAPTFEDFIEKGYDWANETYAKDVTYVRVPNASEATKYDGYTVYVIPTVDELIAASNSETYKANKATFPSKEDSFGGTNGRAHGGFVEKTSVRGDFSTYNTIYITNDLDIPAWEAATGRDFGEEYDGWKLPDSDDPNFWTTAVFVLDGMNHTIKGYEDNRSFFAATFNGVLRNITFVDGTVTATETSTTAFLNNAVEKGGTVYENVHLKGCDLTTLEATANYVGLFAALASNNVRPATYKNCSIDTCTITAPGTVSQIGLFQGGQRTSATLNMENCYAVDSTITVGKLGATEGHGLLIGNVYNTTAQSVKLDNVAAVNCNFKTLDADAANVEKIAVVTRVNELATEGSDVGTIISYGNTKTYTSDEEEVTEPIDYLFRDTLGNFTAQDAVVDGKFIVDSTVKAAINNESDAENVVTAGSLTVDDTLVDLASVIAVMNSTEATADWYLDNGNYVPAYAMVGTTGYRMNVGHTDIADVINNATSGETVKVCLDQEASTVAIPAGVTVELNGAVLDAIVGGEGYVNDDTDGLGGVTGLGTIGAANAQLPLNDKTNGVYRLYNFGIVVGTDGAIDGYKNARKFRLKLNFNNKDAYALLAAGTSGMTLQALLSGEALEEDVPHTFLSVADYATKVAANDGKSYSLVLRVYGMEAVANTDLNITYNVTSAGVAKAATTSYAVPAEEA